MTEKLLFFLSYKNILWDILAKNSANKKVAQVWDYYIECALRVLWICHCNSKMAEEAFSVAKVISLFLALLISILEIVRMNY